MRASLNNYLLLVSLVLNIIAGKYFLDTKSFAPINFEQQASQYNSSFNDIEESAPITTSIISQDGALKPMIKGASKNTKKSSTILVDAVVVENSEPEPTNQSGSSFEDSISFVELAPLSITEYISNIEDTSITIDSVNVEEAYEDGPIFIQPIEKQIVESADSLQLQESKTEKSIPILEINETESGDRTIADKVSFALNVRDKTDVKVIWADNNGKILTVSNSTLGKGTQKVSLDTTDISSGTYTIDIVDLSNNSTLKSVRFIKL